MGSYCGPRRVARVDELADLERRGWIAEEKADGVYAELTIGAAGRVALVRYRSGRTFTATDVARARGRHPCGDVLGLRTPWAPGTVLAGELMASTPAAGRWRALHANLAGVVLYDLLAVGDMAALLRELVEGRQGGGFPALDVSSQPQAARRAQLEHLVGQLEGRAARTLHLVAMRRRRLRDWYEDLIGEGAEGIVLKDPAAPAGRGTAKLKRRDELGCRVVAVLPDEGLVRVSLGGMAPFTCTAPGFAVAVGQLVDVVACGFYGSDCPRHARIVRVRPDLDGAFAAPPTGDLERAESWPSAMARPRHADGRRGR